MYTLRDENQRLEYKTSKNSLPKSFWSTYSSFANTHGGLVVLGIEEVKGKNGKSIFRIAGVSNAEKIKKNCLRLCITWKLLVIVLFLMMM